MPASEHIRIAADLAEVGPAADRVRDLAVSALGEAGGQAVELAFVEAANNVIQHGFPDGQGEPDIFVHTHTEGVTLELYDCGRPMPSDALEGADEPEDPFAESSRGLWLIRVLMDEISYETDSGINRLVLTKRMA